MNKEVNKILEDLSPDKECLVHNYIINLIKENTNLKQVLNEIRKYVRLMGKFDGESCTRNFKMMSADFNHILQIIDKVLGDDEK